MRQWHRQMSKGYLVLALGPDSEVSFHNFHCLQAQRLLMACSIAGPSNFPIFFFLFLPPSHPSLCSPCTITLSSFPHFSKFFPPAPYFSFPFPSFCLIIVLLCLCSTSPFSHPALPTCSTSLEALARRLGPTQPLEMCKH